MDYLNNKQIIITSDYNTQNLIKLPLPPFAVVSKSNMTTIKRQS